MRNEPRLAVVLLLVIGVLAFGGRFLRDGVDQGLTPDAPRRPSVLPERDPGMSPRRERRPRPRLWLAETEDWADVRPVDRTGDFPGYRDPVSPRGLVRGGDSASKFTSGTAFATASSRHWLTARHVVDHCARTVVQAGPSAADKNLRVVDVKMHPHADVALLTTAGPGPDDPPFRITRRDEGRDEAFHIGFPRGRPGAVHSSYLGRKDLRRVTASGRAAADGETVSVWAERSRLPDFEGSLGGLSGGVALDRSGAVIGINSAENRRRGRILTSRTSAIWETIGGFREDYAAPDSRRPLAGFDAERYPVRARDLIREGLVARVICEVGGS